MSECTCGDVSCVDVPCRDFSCDQEVATQVEIEQLAKELHEAGREAVLAGNTVAAEKFGEAPKTFIEWDDCSENVREGRRIQARYLLKKFQIYRINNSSE
jgi:hypothetical protein